jgi:hypothetical protein
MQTNTISVPQVQVVGGGGGWGEGEETSFFVTVLSRYLTRRGGGGGVCQCLRVTRHIHVLAWFLDFNSEKCKIKILFEGFRTIFVLQHLLSFCVMFLVDFFCIFVVFPL